MEKKVFELSQDELDVIATHMDDDIRERCFLIWHHVRRTSS